MSDFAKEVIHINLEDEMRRSYLDYAMSVIVGRALPDARDGLSSNDVCLLVPCWIVRIIKSPPLARCGFKVT